MRRDTPAAPLTVGIAAALALAFAAPFDGYVRHAVLYRDFLVGDIAGAVLVFEAWRQRRRSPSRGWASAVLGLVVLVLLYAAAAARAPELSAVGRIARLTYLSALVWAMPLVLPSVWLPAALLLVVAGTAVRFAVEARAYFGSALLTLAPWYQFGSFTSNPNTLGGFGAVVLPIAVGLALFCTRWRRPVLGVLTAALAAGIVLSFSKGAWISAAAGCAVGLAYSLPMLSRRHVNAAVIAIAIAGSAALLTPARTIPRVMVERWRSYGSELSNAERLRYASSAARIAFRHPWLGTGIGGFARDFRISENAVLGPEDPHDVYLAIAAEAGLPALVCFLLFLAAMLFGGHVIASSATRQDGRLRAGLLGSVAALIVLGLVSSEPLSARTGWVLLSCTLVEVSGAREDVTGA